MKKVVLLLSGLLCVSMVSVAYSWFSDVDEGDFYYDAVKFLSDEGIVHGNPDGSFGYSYPINRAEMLTIVIRAKFKDDDSAEVDAYADAVCFDDSSNQWYTKYICYAKAQGWIAGYPDGTFKPYQNVNFVEALKITMGGLEIGYTPGTDPWYKGLVEAASSKNLIPLTITSFGQEITRGEMADLVARVLKYKAEGLDEWLGGKKDCVVTYETIEAGTDMSVACGFAEGGDTGIYCNSEADCPDPITMSCVDHSCWDGDPCVQCPEGTKCVYDGSGGFVTLVCQEDTTPDYGPLFIDWSFPDGADHTASLNGDGYFEYANNMFSLEIDGSGQYWSGPLTDSDLSTELVEPGDEGLMFNTFTDDEFCSGTASEDFYELVLQTSKLAALEIPIFDIELEGEPFVWWMTVFATRNPLGWDQAGAQSFMSCSGTTMAPVLVIDNYMYDDEDNGAIIWVDECPEKGIEPVKADYCADMRGSVMSQLNPDLIGDQF